VGDWVRAGGLDYVRENPPDGAYAAAYLDGLSELQTLRLVSQKDRTYFILTGKGYKLAKILAHEEPKTETNPLTRQLRELKESGRQVTITPVIPRRYQADCLRIEELTDMLVTLKKSASGHIIDIPRSRIREVLPVGIRLKL
jgi:hypothetical protein